MNSIDLWLNVGSGDFPAPEPWVNIDRNDRPYMRPETGGSWADVAHERHPNLVACSWNVPLPNGSATRIYCGHLLEHLDLYTGEVERTLAEFARLAAPGCEILVVGPETVRTAEAVSRGERSWWDFWAGHGTAGRGNPNGPAYEGRPGDVHRWTSTQEATFLACKLGFPGASVEALEIKDVPNDWPLTARNVDQAAVLVRMPR